MRVFISEFVCGGGWPDDERPESLIREGRAMLAAVVEDFTRLAGVRVTTTWDSRLGPAPFGAAHVIPIEDPEDELPQFRELAHLCDRTLIIAPEIDGILADRTSLATFAGGRLIGCDEPSVRLCTDKLLLARHLESHGVPTIPTFEQDPDRFPIVVKRRDGAGSLDVRLLHDLSQWAQAESAGLIWQPYFPGQAVSCAVFCGSSSENAQACLPAEQTLSSDGAFRYLGGRLPARCAYPGAIQEAALAACATVPGLRGYVGVDLIVPEDAPGQPVVVEINPRLTTSYIGYRRLATGNLAAKILDPDGASAMEWKETIVEYRADGTIL